MYLHIRKVASEIDYHNSGAVTKNIQPIENKATKQQTRDYFEILFKF